MNYILVTPSAPRNVSAKFIRNSFDVSWTKVESGNCPVFYTVQYNETILITGTKLLNYNTSANIIVYIQSFRYLIFDIQRNIFKLEYPNFGYVSLVVREKGFFEVMDFVLALGASFFPAECLYVICAKMNTRIIWGKFYPQ